MAQIVGIILPIFALVAAGFVAGRARWFEESAVKGLSAFVFYLAIPALLFRTLAKQDIPENLNVDILLAYFSGAFAVMAVAWAVGRLAFANGFAELAVMGLGATYSNAVLLGIPLIFAVFGEPGLLPMMMIVGVHALIMLPLAMVLVEIGRGAGAAQGQAIIGPGNGDPAVLGSGPRGPAQRDDPGSRDRMRGSRVVRATAAAVFRNPVILSMLAGIAYNLSGLGLPGPVDRFAELLAGAAAPCALFALGATLAAHRLRGDLRESLAVAGLKLILHPLAVWLLATQVFALDPLWAAVATVAAALPSGVNVFVIARQYDVYLARSSAAVLVSTAISALTLAVLVAYLAPG